MKIISWILILISLGLLLESTTVFAAEKQSTSEGKTLYIGRISRSPLKHYKAYKLMADYLLKELKKEGYTQAKVVFAKNKNEFAEMFKDGRLDIASETLYGASVVMNAGGAEPLLIEKRDGYASYYGIFFVRKDSGILDIENLNGRYIAFEDATSTSGYFLPRELLIEKGYKLRRLTEPRESRPLVDDDVIGYGFAEDELKLTSWIYNGYADVGCLGMQEWNKEKKVPAKMKKELEIIGKTVNVPRSILLVRSNLNSVVKDILKEAFLDASGNEQGYMTIKQYRRSDGYLVIDEGTTKKINEFRESLEE